MSDRKHRISIRFKFLCIITTLVGIFSCVILYHSWSGSNAQMEELLKDKAELALQFDLAIRSYVSETIRPFAQEHTDKDVFIPEVMSVSFVARRIFDKVRKEHPDYTIKFSSDNPRNPLNQAGPEELKVIEYFNNNPNAKRWSGRIKINGQECIALFSAIRMKKKCFQCHGDPKDAPASLVARYGDKAGFHRPTGKAAILDTIAMPVKNYQAAANIQAMKTSIVMITGLALLLVAIYCIFQRMVGGRLAAIAEHFRNAASQNDKIGIKHLDCKGDDEIGDLVCSFNEMVENLESTTISLEKLQQAEKKLQKTVTELEEFNKLAVGRELQMIELKKEVDTLLCEFGRKEKYKSNYEKILSKPLSGNSNKNYEFRKPE